jgi:hypothetical protein
MLEEEINKLLEKEWDSEERELVKKIMDGILYYKRFIPKNFKDDVLMAIQLCNKLKNELEIIKLKEQDIQKEIIEKTEEQKMCNEIENLRNEIEELKMVILADKKTKTNIKYKFYKNINAKLCLFKK